MNLKIFNQNKVCRHFKMDSFNRVLNIDRMDYYIPCIDLADAFYIVPVLLVDQKYLLFQFRGQLYKYACLPNGLTSAPRIFTKLLKPVFCALRKQGHQIMDYLDDTLLMGGTFNACKEAVLSKLEFQIHPEKSKFVPSQEIKFLGFMINSRKMTTCLSGTKEEGISRFFSKAKTTNILKIRDLARMIGKCEAALIVILTPRKKRSIENGKGKFWRYLSTSRKFTTWNAIVGKESLILQNH